jgi:hypothetical protein
MRRNTFPCPICKGKGGETEPILEDGSGPYYPCDACNDTGFIEIDSDIHWTMRHQRIVFFILDNIGKRDVDDNTANFISDNVYKIIEHAKNIPVKSISEIVPIEEIPF